ncbi:MAG: gamma carbonic anhydrase family protein [SAR324 cluster bacterium]|nr:gamma carbonic anhydrase family protein [SAR324 cluster bacterium]
MPANDGEIFAYRGDSPQIDPLTYIAPGAKIIGRVTLGPMVTVWFNTVLRGDLAPIEIGAGSNIQDLTTIHIQGASERTDGKPPRGTKIGRNVTVGHNCIVHGCVVEDDCLIGMNAVVMNGAVVGRGSIVGAGAVVLDEMVIPPFSLVVGSPAKVKKTYPESIIEDVIRVAARAYQDRVALFRDGLRRVAT